MSFPDSSAFAANVRRGVSEIPEINLGSLFLDDPVQRLGLAWQIKLIRPAVPFLVILKRLQELSVLYVVGRQALSIHRIMQCYEFTRGHAPLSSVLPKRNSRLSAVEGH